MFRYIKSFAVSNKEIFKNLSSNSENLIDHLIKVFLWPDVQEQNHWKQEIWKFVHSVPKSKSTNKFPSANKIFEAIWEPFSDVIAEHILLWIGEIEETPIKFSYSNVYKAINEYCKWLSIELSTIGEVKSSEVYSKIEELRIKYFKY